MRYLSRLRETGLDPAAAAAPRVRSLWSWTRRGWRATPLRGGPVLFGGSVAVRCLDAGQDLPQPGGGEGWLCALADARGTSVVIVAANAAVWVRLDGGPVAGGVACARPGSWLAVGAAPERRRWWLSEEGPASVERAAAPGTDAWTLEPFAAGELLARCACGEVYRAATWRAQRRCVTCGFVEDGVYRRLPPDRPADGDDDVGGDVGGEEGDA